jgi:hypothetical protein
VQWEDSTTDDLSPWEVFSTEVTEEDLSNKLKASCDEVKRACQRVADKCHSIIVQVCCCAVHRDCQVPRAWHACMHSVHAHLQRGDLLITQTCMRSEAVAAVILTGGDACSCNGLHVHSHSFHGPTSSHTPAATTGTTRRCTTCTCHCH